MKASSNTNMNKAECRQNKQVKAQHAGMTVYRYNKVVPE
jgi:hypothetical protein